MWVVPQHHLWFLMNSNHFSTDFFGQLIKQVNKGIFHLPLQRHFTLLQPSLCCRRLTWPKTLHQWIALPSELLQGLLSRDIGRRLQQARRGWGYAPSSLMVFPSRRAQLLHMLPSFLLSLLQDWWWEQPFSYKLCSMAPAPYFFLYAHAFVNSPHVSKPFATTIVLKIGELC